MMPIDLTPSGENSEEPTHSSQPSIRRRDAINRIPTPLRRLSTYNPTIQTFYHAFYTPEETDPEKILVTSEQMNDLRKQITKLKEEELPRTSSTNPTIIQTIKEAEEDFVPDGELNPKENTRRNKPPSLEELHRLLLMEKFWELKKLSKEGNIVSNAPDVNTAELKQINDQLDVIHGKEHTPRRIRSQFINFKDLESFLEEKEEQEKAHREAEKAEEEAGARPYLSQEEVNALFGGMRLPKVSSNPMSRSSTPDSESSSIDSAIGSSRPSSADLTDPSQPSSAGSDKNQQVSLPFTRMTDAVIQRYKENSGRETTV